MKEIAGEVKNLFLREGFYFECKRCLRCCRGDWQVKVHPLFMNKIKQQPVFKEIKEKLRQGGITEEVEQRCGSVKEATEWGLSAIKPVEEYFIKYDHHDPSFTILKDDNKRCFMLDEEGLCLLHRRMGIAYKPLPCYKFPFTLSSTPDGDFGGISFACCSAPFNPRENFSVEGSGIGKISSSTGGVPLKDLEGVFRYLQKGEYYDVQVGNRINLFGDLYTCWQGYQDIESFILSKTGKRFSVNIVEIIYIMIVMIDRFMKFRATADETEKNRNRESDIRVQGEEDKTGTESKERGVSNGGTIKDRPTEKNKIEKEKIWEFISSVSSLPEGLGDFLTESAIFPSMLIISIMESLQMEDRKKNTEIFMQGGSLTCNSFNNIYIKPMTLFDINKTEHVFDLLFIPYIDHLIWRKFLVREQSLLEGIVSLLIIFIIVKWYAYNSMMNRNSLQADNKDLPSVYRQEDLLFAVYKVEDAFWHSTPNFTLPLIRFFTRQIYDAITG